MKDNRMSKTWHNPIEFILYIVTELKLKIYTWLIWEKELVVGLVGAPTMLELPHSWVIRIENIIHSQKKNSWHNWD